MDLTPIGLFITTRFAFLNRLADQWNNKVRIPIARKIAKVLVTIEKRNLMLDLISKVLMLAVLFSILSIYAIPMVIYILIPVDKTLGLSILVIGITYFIFEEWARLLRKINQAIDERVGNKPYGTDTLYKWPTHNRNKLTKTTLIMLVLVVGFLGALIMQVGAAYDQANVPNTSSNVETLKLLGSHLPFMLLLITWVFAPIVEELFFRGILLRTLLYTNPQIIAKKATIGEKRFIVLFSLVAQATVFSLSHRPNTYGYGLAILISGLLLGGLTVYTGRIKYSVYAHIILNVLGVFISMLLTSL